MPRIRIRVRTVMIAIATMAVVMGLLKNVRYWIDQPPSSVAVLVLVAVMTIIVLRHTTKRPDDQSDLEQRSERLCRLNENGDPLTEADVTSSQSAISSSSSPDSAREYANCGTSPGVSKTAGPWSMFKPASLLPVLFFAGFLFVMDALMVNIVFLSLLVGIFQVVVGLPLLFLKDGRRQRLRNIAIFVGVLVMVVVMVKVNAYIAPLHADRLIEAIESYRAATGVYPKKLDDLVPKFIDHVPCAQYTLGGIFWYTGGGTAEPPMLWYNPHGMDHRIYRFKTKDWGYLG
jgi:hypothetical protein